MSQFELFDGAEHSLQVALLIFEHESGQSLQHQSHVEHQHRVAGRHMPGLVGEYIRKARLDSFKIAARTKSLSFLLHITFSSICLHSWSFPHLKSALARYSSTSVFWYL